MTHPATSILPYPELASPLAKHDLAALNELSDASQVRAWTRRKVARYKKYITALLAIHNSLSPINKLPTEILQKVFSHIPFYSRRCSASWMTSLQRVCRRWRSVLLATPEFWLRGLHIILDPPPRMLVAFTHEPVVDSDEDDDEQEDDDDDITSYSNPRDLFLDRSAPCPLKLTGAITSTQEGLGWEIFEDHFDRVTVFKVEVQDEDELYDVVDSITTSMPRLEQLELGITYESDIYPGDDLTLTQWKAEDLPRLTQLQMIAPLFCRATTVPSLQKIELFSGRDIASLPGLLNALEGCPALASLSLMFGTLYPTKSRGDQTLDRMVNLPHLRMLDICADVSDTSCFLSYLAFPSTTNLKAYIDDDIGDQFALPCILPRRLSGLHTAPTVDRLYLHSEQERFHVNGDPWSRPKLSMTGHVQCAERLEVTQACRLRNAAHFLQFLEAFSACTVTELALDLGPLPSDVDADLWGQFFASLPDVRRLELLSRTTQSRTMKRVIAEHFLASVQTLQHWGGHGSSLAWVLHCAGGSDRSHLQEELHDIEQVLLNHASMGGRLQRVELYITTAGPEDIYWARISCTAHIATDREGSRFVTRHYVSRLSAAADVVTVAGGWGFAEDDELNAEELKSPDDDGEDIDGEEREEETDSDDMQVV